MASAAAAALIVAACGTAGSGTRSTAPAVAAGGPVTLRTLDALKDTGPNATQTALVQAFEALHPNISIARTGVQFDDLMRTVKPKLGSPSAPDAAEGNQGRSIDGSLVSHGLIKPLTAYATQFGWDRLWSRETLAPNRFSNDGKQFGTGTLWGVSSRAEILGVFYDKAKFASYGMRVPTTFAQFEAILAKSKAEGQPAFMLGNRDQYPGAYYFMELVDHYNAPGALRDWVFGKPGATIDTAGTRRAGAKLAQWARTGYFERGYNTLSEADARLLFTRSGILSITGPWVNTDLVNTMDDTIGFFLLPPEHAGDPVKATGALSLPNHISAKTLHEPEAAQWLDFLTGEQAALTILRGGDLPARPLSNPPIDPGSSMASIVAAWKSTSQGPNLVPYLDWATPTMYSTMSRGVWRLMAGTMSPQALAKSLQADWARTYG
jgi:raffinose/stachyose/melibiose transport system substrate-binding protein